MKRDSQRAAWTAFVEGGKPAGGNKAVGRLRAGERNKTEAEYESYLELRKQVGEILWYEFERITFRLADDCRYTPDFIVMLASFSLECHEIKGTTTLTRKSGATVKAPYFEDDAKVKLKVAAQMFPVVFKVVYKVDGNWIEEEI